MYNVIQLQGQRQYMEDTYIVDENFVNGYSLYAIFDGHGGSQVAMKCREHLKTVLSENLLKYSNDIASSLIHTFNELDDLLSIEESYMTGTTCLIILKKPDHIWVANCGDSRAIINAGNSFEYLSKDHKPIKDERARIEQLGGIITNFDGTWRVGGELAVSRAIGDKRLRPYVIAQPEVLYYKLTPFNKFIILATDGLWDIIKSKNANILVQMEYQQVQLSDKVVLDLAREHMFDFVKERAEDNTTIVLVHLRR